MDKATKTSNTDDLPTRLRKHAAIHDAATSPYDEEQAQWAHDLRDAAEFIERMAKAGMIYNGVVGIPTKEWSDMWFALAAHSPGRRP